MKNQFSMSFETITPEMAVEYLEYNKDNRPPKRTRISLYAKDMKAGNWLLSPQGISFDTAGNLIDGQNRLFAIIKAGVPADMAVFRDVAPEVKKVLDDGVKRNASDVLSFEGEQNTNTAASICNRIMSYNAGKISISRDASGNAGSGLASNSFSRTEVLDFFKLHRDTILELTEFGNHIYSQQSIRISTPSEFGLLLYVFGRTTDAREFISNVALGVNISKDTSEFALRQRLVKSATGEIKMNGADKLTLWKRAFEKRGTLVKILKL